MEPVWIFPMISCICLHAWFAGLPAVITLSISSSKNVTFCGMPYIDALKKLEEAGADVVGLNCGRGPRTLLPLIAEAKAACKVIL